MKITKFGHCCLLIEENGVRILTDPGFYTTEQDNLRNIDIILITHEHADHLHMASVKTMLKNNPQAKIVTNASVGKILAAENIVFEKVGDGDKQQFGSVTLEGLGTQHAEIFEEYGQVENTGYLINNKLFYPGDALHNPKREVEVLAFPTPGSWANIKESISYVLEIKPKKAFPVHDGAFKNTKFMYDTFRTIIQPRGTEVILPELNKEFIV